MKNNELRMALSEKDLRIGNLVKWYDVSKVLELHSEKNKFDNVYIECEESFEWTEYNKLEPIPLTEEWLLKFGFLIIEINGKFEATLPNFRYNIYWNKYTDGFLFCDGETVLINFNYVHELQNLVFVLGQRELTVA